MTKNQIHKQFQRTFLINKMEDIDVFILAGQSNAQGWQGDALQYPQDPEHLDSTIKFYWVTPGFSSSKGKWTTLQAQGGRFPSGHFGPEITFARALKQAGYNPAIFKYTLGSTSIAHNWKSPGNGGLYDQMVKSIQQALQLLKEEDGNIVTRAFIWIQGESDAETIETATLYKKRLSNLITHLRKDIIRNSTLPVIIGVDEQHPNIIQNPHVLHAQYELAKENRFITFSSMNNLLKADNTHLQPKGLEEHGKRLYASYITLIKNT